MTADLPTHPSTEAERRVHEWNATVPAGTPCHWWTLMDRGGEKRTSVTRSKAWLLSSGDPVVLVEGLSGGLHLDCVQPLPLGSEEAFLALADPPTEAAGWSKSTGPWPHPCPNGKCEHAGHFHDIDTHEDPKPMCTFEDCPCGKPTVAPSTEAVGEVRRREEIVVDLKRLHDSLPADYERERRELPQRILAERNAAVADVAKLITEVEKLRSDLSAMTLERDLAIAYDRQAYPTADAYERVCASHRRYRDLADRATAFLVNLADHDAKVGGVEAGKLRSEFAAHVATQPDLCSLVDQLEQALQQLSAMTSDRDWLRGELNGLVRERAILRGALERLVELKDGPRDEAYTLAKDAAWVSAHIALAATKED